MKEAISYQNMTNLIGFSNKVKNLFISYFLWPFIFSILLQHHISKFSKYFRSNFLSVQVSEPYKAILQT